MLTVMYAYRHMLLVQESIESYYGTNIDACSETAALHRTLEAAKAKLEEFRGRKRWHYMLPAVRDAEKVWYASLTCQGSNHLLCASLQTTLPLVLPLRLHGLKSEIAPFLSVVRHWLVALANDTVTGIATCFWAATAVFVQPIRYCRWQHVWHYMRALAIARHLQT